MIWGKTQDRAGKSSPNPAKQPTGGLPSQAQVETDTEDSDMIDAEGEAEDSFAEVDTSMEQDEQSEGKPTDEEEDSMFDDQAAVLEDPPSEINDDSLFDAPPDAGNHGGDRAQNPEAYDSQFDPPDDDEDFQQPGINQTGGFGETFISFEDETRLGGGGAGGGGQYPGDLNQGGRRRGHNGAPIGSVPASVKKNPPQENVLATPFAGEYRSVLLLKAPGNSLLPALKHVNCNYLSTSGLAPSLTQLKQHAQALTVLIKNLSVSTRPGVIDNKTLGLSDDHGFHYGETFDWLNDLTTPYEGPERDELRRHHDLPLTSLVNKLETITDCAYCAPQTLDICPMRGAVKTIGDGPGLPYATRLELVKHANEIMELLDHELAAKGGLMSVLPDKETDPEDREKAEATIFGQLIVFTQRLVARVHDLERLYANAMDCLASEALVPHQALSRMGPDGRKGREMVYPQDRFVLVNAGEDLWSFLNNKFEEEERVDEKVADYYKSQGVSGEKMWIQKSNGREYQRGITKLDITTRYYRLRKDPLKTIFVIPAHSQHPGTSATRNFEKQPTVVNVVKPSWPIRASTLELQHREQIENGKVFETKLRESEYLLENAKHEIEFLKVQHANDDNKVEHLKKKVAKLEDLVNDPTNPASVILTENIRLQAEKDKFENDFKEATQAKQDEKTQLAAERQTVATERRALQKERNDFDLLRIRNNELEAAKRMNWDRLDAENAGIATDIQRKLRGVWEEQFKETLALIEVLRKRRDNKNFGNIIIPADIAAKAARDAAQMIDDSIREVEDARMM